MAEKAAAKTWRNRIVGHGEESPEQLLANPFNWRIHPKAQQDALTGALSEIGWIQDVIVNRTTGHVVDGHARIALAISRQEPMVPVVYVELTENEERIALLSLDPVGQMALMDQQMVDTLAKETDVSDEALRRMVDSMASPVVPDDAAPPILDDAPPDPDVVVLTCPHCGEDFEVEAVIGEDE